ncbi:hypothetical protein H257_09376 [Aphanomyces astaci]|uniref:Cytochrome b mRNA-processing protein 4 n=1 Tax=Aphanomyces astaci TaxID=112090 RepID=W4GD15_APHAT|nr:hypothetical protein H257_09376 [Aphanomyces astaci]ETV76969.1 hypothetical protein H257_09376 [Aphanomyces astaci]RHY17690.1 hypothetical protein DYB25_010650 [Aphanomyces astaci]RHY19508.1 hypothetical protein DYB36_010637 [Aphanomyces astaci]RHY43201.1 hypothetical protein DYB38_011472 [Aphanomyces astaci]RHY46407.1 hypothetical protein DYB30_012346 [Aphanomyces astaci]|eukprot:XP_009833881.1 hypothetical protein H257_09376 [Aphanomyces astaci]
MKIYKMLVHWGIMLTVPTAIALTVFKPLDEDGQRAMLEAKYKDDIDRQKKNRSKIMDLLRPSSDTSEGKARSDEFTDRVMKGDPATRPAWVKRFE